MIAQTVMIVGWDPPANYALGISTQPLVICLDEVCNGSFLTVEQKPRTPMHKPLPLHIQGRMLLRQKVKMFPRRLPQRRNRNLHIQ